jgi:riboflavin synthase
MFTGLIEEIGTIKNIQSLGGGKKIQIDWRKILTDSKIDDSIAVNGICQTITGIGDNRFEYIAVEETLNRTTINSWTTGKKVNLERALKLSDRLGGHLMQGHIDDIGKVRNISKIQSSTIFEIQFPRQYSKYIIPKGSIAIDGISLTIMDLLYQSFKVSIIPHTVENSTLKYLKNGEDVNLEFDLIGKYVERLMQNQNNSGITFEKIGELGY